MTITDDQIRQLLADMREGRQNAHKRGLRNDCLGALDGSITCRERCAKTWANQQKAKVPTRSQWRVLATLRNGPTKRLPSQKSIRTALSLRRRGWVDYDKDAAHYALSEAGRAALAVGDRRYQASEIAYARRAL